MYTHNYVYTIRTHTHTHKYVCAHIHINLIELDHDKDCSIPVKPYFKGFYWCIYLTTILVCGWIKETSRVYMVVKPQRMVCINSCTPVVNGYMMQSKMY